MEVGFAVAAALHLSLAGVSAWLLRSFRAAERRDPTDSSCAANPLRDSTALIYAALAVGSWFLISQYRVLLPLDLLHHRLPGDLLGLLNALNALVVMTAVFAGARHFSRRSLATRLQLMSVGAAVIGVGWTLCALPGIVAILGAVVVTSLGESLFCSVVDANIVTFAPNGSIGTYLGLSTVAWGVGGALAGFSGGVFDLAASHSALTIVWIALAAVGILCAIGTQLFSARFLTATRRRVPALR